MSTDPAEDWRNGSPPPEAGMVVVRWRNQQVWRWKKYKPGAPKNLLAKGGRWQCLNDYGGWENVAPGIEPDEWSPT